MKTAFFIALSGVLAQYGAQSQVTDIDPELFSRKFQSDTCGCLGIRIKYIREDSLNGLLLINSLDFSTFTPEKVSGLLGRADREYTFPAEFVDQGLHEGDVSWCYDLMCNETCGPWDESPLVLEIVFLGDRVKRVQKFEPEPAPFLIPIRD